jgi:Na+-driven multidrug efflux pump
MKYEEIKQSSGANHETKALTPKVKYERPVVITSKPDENTSWWTEAKFQLAFSFPIVIQTCSQQTMMLTDLVFVGRLGSNELAVIGISGYLNNILLLKLSDFFFESY